MSTDLSLLPVHAWRPSDAASYTVLRCDLGGLMRGILADLPEQEPVPDDFYHYIGTRPRGGDSFARGKRDDYGEVIKVIPATVLVKRLRDHISEVDTPTNRAVLAYLRALEPETRIGLYWH